jgi:crotonobetaine/carnitine-CoA ligase
MDRERVLPHCLAARAAADPGHLLLQEVTGREHTYGEVHETALIWADAIRRLGIDAGDTVATMTPNGFESYFAWIGISWLRALEVPINTMNRGHMLEYQLDNCRARVLVFCERYLDQLAEVSDKLEHAEIVVIPDLTGDPPPLKQRVVGPDEFFAGASPATGLNGPEPWDIACIIYTSGTTGPSKGVLVPWAELYQFAAAIPDGTLDAGGANYACLPTFHVGGKATLYVSVLAGARTVLREVFSVSEFMNDVRAFNCTTTGLIGIMAQLLAATPEQPDDADNPLHFINTAPLWPAIEDFERRFGVQVYTGYGMTEVGAPLFVVDRVDWRSCGRVRPGYQLRVVDEHDLEVPHGEVGELIIRTDEPWNLNAGYFEMPEATAAAWRNGWFHTGDGFRRDDDGNFYFVDRLKDAMRRKGENISSLEVEGYVREHPAVLEVAAIAAPSDFGPGEDEVKICVVPKPDAEIRPDQLLEFLQPRMPRFMHPRYVEVVAELPKTPTARIRKFELRDQALTPTTWDRDNGAYVTPS